MKHPDFPTAAEQLMSEIESETKLTASMTGIRELSANTLRAMKSTPRHQFVRDIDESFAYANRPLPIGEGQTISQPFIVALMTDILGIESHEKVLEIGTGCGYQTAVLSHLAKAVYSVERIGILYRQAKKKLADLGYTNVFLRHGDGYEGWAEFSPYDKMMVTAAAPSLPPALMQQLRPGGLLVIPIGGYGYAQELMLFTKNKNGDTGRKILDVAFVPLSPGKI